MEIKFTASIMVALEFVLRLRNNQLTIPRTKGSDDRVRVAAPCWGNFVFFSRIVATQIQRKKRIEPGPERRGSWEIDREIEFYHMGHRVAVVSLIGRKYDGDTVEGAFWAVSRFGYFSVVGGRSDEPTGWHELETWPICGLALQVA